jgi:hypothetical protein
VQIKRASVPKYDYAKKIHAKILGFPRLSEPTIKQVAQAFVAAHKMRILITELSKE